MIDTGASNKWLEQAALKRQELKGDPHRPVFHFLPPSSWMNDPNGLIYWQGQYHMFYQYNPHEAAWGAPHWGHAVSRDLVHWQDLPPALTPDMQPVDDGGCWSGCTVNHAGIPTVFYTGVKGGKQTTCMATADETLVHWQKHPDNPVLTAPGLPGFRQQDYRDPFVWQDGDTWYQVVSMSFDGKGQVLLYRSGDLQSWEYLHPLIPNESRAAIQDVGDVWECPNFFRLGDQWLLIVSLWKDHKLLYSLVLVGDFVDGWFYPKSVERLDWGEHCYYAPLTFEVKGRRLMFGWLQEQRSKDEQLNAGWSGVMSLPRELFLEELTLQQRFVSELQSLRREHVAVATQIFGQKLELGTFGQALEIQLRLSPQGSSTTTFAFEYTTEQASRLDIDWQTQQLRLVTPDGSDYRLHFAAEDGLKLHIYVDHSVIELIANQQLSLVARVYPERADSTCLWLDTEGESLLHSLEIWSLASVW